MKTLSSFLIVIMGMLFIVPRVTNVDAELDIPKEIVTPYQETTEIRARKQKIELIKSHIGVVMSEVKLKMPVKI